MMRRILTVVLLAVACCVTAAEALKSGPQVGEAVPGPFEPYNLTGPSAGEDHCLYCQFGSSPVAVVFAREITPALTMLVKKLDEATGTHAKAEMGSYVVFLNKEPSLQAAAKELAKKEGIKHTILSSIDVAPKKYAIADAADVTVLLYVNSKVQANHAFKKGEFTDKSIAAIVGDVAKIVK
jgi:hypothetical protein